MNLKKIFSIFIISTTVSVAVMDKDDSVVKNNDNGHNNVNMKMENLPQHINNFSSSADFNQHNVSATQRNRRDSDFVLDSTEIARQNNITEQILTNYLERRLFPHTNVNRKIPTIAEILPKPKTTKSSVTKSRSISQMSPTYKRGLANSSIRGKFNNELRAKSLNFKRRLQQQQRQGRTYSTRVSQENDNDNDDEEQEGEEHEKDENEDLLTDTLASCRARGRKNCTGNNDPFEGKLPSIDMVYIMEYANTEALQSVETEQHDQYVNDDIFERDPKENEIDNDAADCPNCVDDVPYMNKWTMPLLKLGEKRYYLGIFFKANWFKATQYCRYHGMHLASISSQEENDRLEKHIRDYGLGHEHFWTSGTDLADEGSFFWMSTGRPITFTNWNAGEPNNFRYENGEEENCLELWNRDGKGLKWNDSPCSFETFFVCEVQPN